MIGVGTDISKNFCDFAKKRVEYELKQRSKKNKNNNNSNKDKSNFSKQASLF